MMAESSFTLLCNSLASRILFQLCMSLEFACLKLSYSGIVCIGLQYATVYSCLVTRMYRVSAFLHLVILQLRIEILICHISGVLLCGFPHYDIVYCGARVPTYRRNVVATVWCLAVKYVMDGFDTLHATI